LFSNWTDDIKKLFDWNVANDGPAIVAAWNQLDAYLEDMIARRRRTLSDDLISDLIRAEDDGDRLTHEELLMLAATLLGAGTDTTRNQLAAGGTGAVRAPRSVGTAGRASRTRAERCP
jgi:cytochrome P450